jgi:hypothetical protein
MTHAPSLRGGFPGWRADAGLPSDRLRPARLQGVTEGALHGLVLEQGGAHKIILPQLGRLQSRDGAGSGRLNLMTFRFQGTELPRLEQAGRWAVADVSTFRA